MPLIFSSNEATESGHSYADRTGISYEYPKRYSNLIKPGERFIYYRGRRRLGGPLGRPVYFGAGVVGRVRPSPGKSDLLACDVLDYRPFVDPVPFKDSDGRHLEIGGERRGFYQPGVRRIGEALFERIAAYGRPRVAPPEANYANPETARKVEDYAVEVAKRAVAERFPGSAVVAQPRNNPGFDIRVGSPEKVLCYVEVKGTQDKFPRFFMSEGERRFSGVHLAEYLLIVVYHINLIANSHEVLLHTGPLNDRFSLEPVQWFGESL